MKNLTLVRHAQSIGNMSDKSGTHATEIWRKKHNATWRISPNGQVEAKRVGDFIKNANISYKNYYVSHYIRALETASYMNLPNAQWKISPLLREKASGIVQHHPYSMRHEIAPYYFDSRDSTVFDTRSYNGESMAALYDRLLRFLNDIESGNTLIVSHGYAIRVMCMIIECITPWEFNTRYHTEKIPNASVITYAISDNETEKTASSWKSGGWHTQKKIFLNSPRTYSNSEINAIIKHGQ